MRTTSASMRQQRPNFFPGTVSTPVNASLVAIQQVQLEVAVVMPVPLPLPVVLATPAKEAKQAVAEAPVPSAALATAPTGTTTSGIDTSVFPGELTVSVHPQPRQATSPVVPCGGPDRNAQQLHVLHQALMV